MKRIKTCCLDCAKVKNCKYRCRESSYSCDQSGCKGDECEWGYALAPHIAELRRQIAAQKGQNTKLRKRIEELVK